LARRLRRSDAELIITNSLKSAMYGGVAGRLAGVPVVWHLRDRIASDYLPAPAATLVRLLARILPSGIIANSEATLATLRLTARARRRLTVQAIGSPCEMAGEAAMLAAPALAPSTRSTAVANQTGGQIEVGMVGRIAPWKGQDVFLRAFAAAYPAGSAARAAWWAPRCSVSTNSSTTSGCCASSWASPSGWSSSATPTTSAVSWPAWTWPYTPR